MYQSLTGIKLFLCETTCLWNEKKYFGSVLFSKYAWMEVISLSKGKKKYLQGEAKVENLKLRVFQKVLSEKPGIQ